MGTDNGTDDSVDPAVCGRLNVVVTTPPQHRGLQVAWLMIPGHDVLAQPGLQGLDIRDRGGTHTHERTEAAAIPRPRTSLPIISCHQRGIDVELLRDVVQGDGG